MPQLNQNLFDGVVAMNNMSMTFEVGEVIALIGPDGTGKTTLFHPIKGLSSSLSFKEAIR